MGGGGVSSRFVLELGLGVGVVGGLWVGGGGGGGDGGWVEGIMKLLFAGNTVGDFDFDICKYII